MLRRRKRNGEGVDERYAPRTTASLVPLRSGVGFLLQKLCAGGANRA